MLKYLAAAGIGALVYGGILLLMAGAVSLAVVTGEYEAWPWEGFCFGAAVAPFLALGAGGLAWVCVEKVIPWWEGLS